MRVLVDECVDWRLLRDLHPHEAKTVKQLGWEKVDDGSLLARAAADFDVFITVDTKLPYQQNIAAFDISVIILRGRTTRLPIYANCSADCEKFYKPHVPARSQ